MTIGLWMFLGGVVVAAGTAWLVYAAVNVQGDKSKEEPHPHDVGTRYE